MVRRGVLGPGVCIVDILRSMMTDQELRQRANTLALRIWLECLVGKEFHQERASEMIYQSFRLLQDTRDHE